MTREQFEREFDSRTLAYAPGFVHASWPLVVVVGPAAHTAAGHALLVSLANQIARAHRRIIFVGELERPLLCADVFGAGTLAAATAGLAHAINPFVEVDIVLRVPAVEALLTIGVGADSEVELALGCDGWVALLGSEAPVGGDEPSIWGGLLASCLGANTAMHRILGRRGLRAGSFSLWDYVRGSAIQGPPVRGPLDIGRVLQVGAGAVGSALDFFASFFGITGAWTIVDGDTVDVSNLNRQLLFTARGAGFPDGEPVNKAKRAAELLGPAATASPAWFHTDEAVVEGKYDVVLALANDYGVRSFLQGRQPTVLMHATTSRSWQAQLHRHIAGRDDCIDCRLPPETPRFRCSEEDVETPTGEHFDAAIPPISATASLLLAAELRKLQEGMLVEPLNFTAVELSDVSPIVQRKRRRCREGCSGRRPATLRQEIDAHSRWRYLDGEHAGESRRTS
jgi:ThiF family